MTHRKRKFTAHSKPIEQHFGLSMRWEPADRQRSRNVMHLVPFACALVVLSAACTSQTSAPIPTPRRITHQLGASDVVIQLNDYLFGGVPDEFLVGPELIVYGDGSVYAELPDGVKNQSATLRLVTGHLDETEVQRFLLRADSLPTDAPVGQAVADAIARPLIIGTHQWEINDESIEPFGTYLRDLQSAVEKVATTEWSPARWIDRPYPSSTCSVVERSTTEPWYNAPVYPHLLDHYPLGQFTCFGRG